MPRRLRRRSAGNENVERWLLTYADLITLLLAFFIVMYSMSSMDDRKFGRMATAFSGVLHGEESARARVVAPGAGGNIPDYEELLALREQIEAVVEAQQLKDKIATMQDERGLVIRVMDQAAFDPGSADLKPRMFAILDLLASQVSVMDNHVRVEGHTDNRPISTIQFPSNWELSTARATRVVRYLVEEQQLDPRRISALGYGPYRPVADNADPAGRARNRRVDLIVLVDRKNEPEAEPQRQSSPLAVADSLLSR